MDLASVYKKRGRQPAPNLALIVMEDTADIHDDLQTSVENAKEKGLLHLRTFICGIQRGYSTGHY